MNVVFSFAVELHTSHGRPDFISFRTFIFFHFSSKDTKGQFAGGDVGRKSVATFQCNFLRPEESFHVAKMMFCFSSYESFGFNASPVAHRLSSGNGSESTATYSLTRKNKKSNALVILREKKKKIGEGCCSESSQTYFGLSSRFP